MAEYFGDLERLAADLYPYRWPIAVGIMAVIVATGTFGYRKGWHIVDSLLGTVPCVLQHRSAG